MSLPPIAIIGPGRLGRAIADALRRAGTAVVGPLGRDRTPGATDGAPIVLLCVPDRDIATVAAALRPGPIVGHCSASVPLDALAPHERFSAHPLLAVTGETPAFEGAACAIDASSPAADRIARALADTLGMRPIHVSADQRALYHAAATAAANFLVTLETAAERLAAAAGVPRAQLVPLVRAAVAQWETFGAPRALTGPIARGDNETVARQRAAVARAAPDLLPLWDAMTDATRALAGRGAVNAPPRPNPS